MDDDVIRILISTDNHLGVYEKDAIRSNDCFAAFEEVLATAKNKKADFVLLGGDMFHENKPSRRTIHGAISLLNKYCLGDNPVYIEVLNNQEEVFKAAGGKVNYDSPFLAIGMPVFSIHGNHDDPSREGGPEPLAALDILSASNLVNYIGKCEQVDDIEIVPVLIRKGTSMLALYSLGAIRDERLNRMWYQKKVKFVRPSVEQGRDLYFNIFVVHQNRDYGRGTKNCLHESMIPEWMDLVVWGNEHECQPDLVESLVGTFRIFQPGSSIATSLVEGESMSNPKHMGMIEVKGRFFRMQPIPYTQIRPYIYSDIMLSSIPDLDANDPKIEDKIHSVLSARVRHMIEEARKSSDAVEVAGAGQQFHIDRPEMVLVRLRVDHTGYPTINQQRFGSSFLDLISNPSSALLFAKKKREVYGGVVDANISADAAYRNVMGEDADDLDDPMSRIKIEDLVKESLEGNQRQLNVLIEADMAQAIDNFVLKKHLSAITDIVQETLEKTQEALFKNITATGKEQIAEHTMKIRKREEKERLRQQAEAKGKPVADDRELSIFSKNQGAGDSGMSEDNSDDDGPGAKKGGRGKLAAGRGRGGATGRGAGGRGRGGAGRGGEAKATSAAAKKKAKVAESEDEEAALSIDDFSDDEPVTATKRGRGGGKVAAAPAKAAPKSTASAKATVSSKTTKAAPKRASARASAAGGKRKYAEESDDEDISEGDDDASDFASISSAECDDDDVEEERSAKATSFSRKKVSAVGTRGKKTATTTGNSNKRGRGIGGKGISPTMSSPDRGVRGSSSRRGGAAAGAAATFSSTNDAVDLTEDW